MRALPLDRRPWYLAIVVLALATGLASQAPGQPPNLSFGMPHAVPPGAATDVTFYGANFEGANRLWTSFPAEVALTPDVPNNGATGNQVVYRLTVPADAPLGVAAVRLATGRGISETRLMLIDDLPSAADNGANKTVETAQEIKPPVAVDGACEAESFDYFKFSAVTGQRISVEVVAHRMGSPLDPAVRLIDSAGKELAYSDDEGGLGADGRFAYQFTADGVYYLELRDIRYQGSGGHRYRLRVGDFPLVNNTYPLGALAGSATPVELVGPDAAGLRTTAPIPTAAAGGVANVAARRVAGQGAGFAQLAAGNRLEQVEFEPNDTAETASGVVLPGAINGRFAVGKDRDYYQFEAKQGQRFLMAGKTRTLGSPTDLFLRIYKSDGGAVAEVDDSGTSEGVLDFNCPADGVYRLMVEDLHRRGGPEHVYRIEVEPYAAGFSLVVEVERLNPPQAGVFSAKVVASRRDYNGPIAIALEGGPDGLQLSEATIPEGKNDAVIRGTVPATAAIGSSFITRVVGRATIGDAQIAAVASTTGVLKNQLAGLAFPPTAVDGLVGLGVGPAFPDFFKLSVEGQPALFPQLVGSTTFKVKAEKLNGFDDNIALAVEGLPAGFSADVKPIEKGKPEAEVTLKGPLAAAETEFTIRIAGSSTFQEQPRRVVLDGVAVRIVRPLLVSLVPAGPITAGGAQKAKLTVTRFGGANEAVSVTLRNLPLGVSGPQSTVIAAGQNEVEIELKAAADAAIGHFEGLHAVASTVVGGKPIVAESGAAALDVAMAP